MIFSCNVSRFYHFARMFSSSWSIYHAVIKFKNVCIMKISYYSKIYTIIEDISVLFLLRDVNWLMMLFRFQCDIFINFLLEMQNSQTIRSRDRSSNMKNKRNEEIIKREQAFETSIVRQLSQFERVKMKIVLNNQEKMTSKI